MPSRIVVARELAEIFKVLAHPDRIRLIEEIGKSELDVNSLSEVLELPGPRVSQHLSLLKAHRIVEERREGRHRVYHLVQPQLAAWIVGGLDFIELRSAGADESNVRSARELWSERSDSSI